MEYMLNFTRLDNYYIKSILVSGLSKGVDEFNALNLFVETSQVNYVQPQSRREWSRGIVPFYFDSHFYDELLLSSLERAMFAVESVSCVRFKALEKAPAADADDSFHWLHFTNPNEERECVHSTRARANGEIVVVLGLDCLKKRDILHTLLHGIGFEDEITHPQRDRYVRIMWENIHPKYRFLFRVSSSNSSASAVEYDPSSVMHFHDRAYSSNGQATIGPLLSGLHIRPSDHLSLLDKMKLRLLFSHECNKRSVVDLMEKCKIVFREKSSHITESRNYENNNEHVITLNEKSAENVASNKLQAENQVPNEVENEEQTKKIENINVDVDPTAQRKKLIANETLLSDDELIDKKK